jgi:predicted ATPase
MTNRGSEWHRWEPHIHSPGTLLNNQFGSGNPWGAYLTTLEDNIPPIEAIAVTDYYVTDTYEEFIRHKTAGRLPNVKLVFPNVELRLDIAAKTGFVNIHLLVSPEDNDHVEQVKRILKRLQFGAYSDRFDCSREELIRLGKRADPTITDDTAALRHGVTQVKVNFDQLRKVFSESDWAKKHILVAVAGAAGDGTSGLRQAADKTVREEIEKFAHIIFSSNPAQREFWLGQRSGVSQDYLRARYDGCKPCLHGSDAHDQASVGQPVQNRFSWIKGALEFDSLRQACIDPGSRAYIGERPPSSATPSQVITHIRIDHADWAITPNIPLNPGLVAIIGARGSGKTALADVIAAGCDAIPPAGWNADENKSPSFLARARSLIGDATATLTWGGGGMVIINEQDALAGLYAPLMARLAASSGTLNKLSFSVRRIADVQQWGTFAEEELLDRRKAGPFYGRGSLIIAATASLKTAWETGSSADVQAAMTGFMNRYLKDLLLHAPYAPVEQSEFRAWSRKFAHWLFGTDHITVRYEISYDGVDIRKLSPGTRGIVLLLLYLALDDADDRPLIIDQPEENLDPKSVFDELVSLFIAAKATRQVIMVTHNANLVINTDADQIIIAEAGPHPSGGLPPITYASGGLEDKGIRKAVCEILEGGEPAFRERARRLRVRLDR